MKKLLVAVVLGAVFILALATTAQADNGPHGGFTATASECAGCHRAHSAQDPAGFLLIAPIEDICLSCHDGAGAYTNVVDGVYAAAQWDGSGFVPTGYAGSPSGEGDTNAGLFGGGFTNAAMAHTWNGKKGYDMASLMPSPEAVTSSHTHDGTVGTVWGSGNNDAVNTTPVASTLALECTSCHDPHGNAGKSDNTLTGDPVPSYRLLRFQPNGSNGFEVTAGVTNTTWNNAAGNPSSTAGITVTDVATKWYTPNNNIASDGTVAFWRSRFSGGAWGEWSSYITAAGDYAGRGYVYYRPAATITADNLTDTQPNIGGYVYTCVDGSGNLPALPTDNGDGTWTTHTFPCGATTGTLFDNTTPRVKMGFWCGTCHDRYVARSARTTNSGDAYYTYRHTSVAVSSSSGVACVDCHVAHGSPSVMTDTNTDYPTASLTTGGILMKTDERSVCLKCHGGSVNFEYTP